MAKEKLLNKDDASQSFFFRALKIKKKQSLIKLLKDDQGNELIDPNSMASTMLTFLSRIIGQEEDQSSEVLHVQSKILGLVKPCISLADAIFLDRPISAIQCEKAVLAMGLEKSPRWDGLSVKLFREF